MTTIRTHRERRGWSRAELARRSGLNASTVSCIENGRLKPYPGQMAKLADAFGVRLEQLDDRTLDIEVGIGAATAA